MGGTGKGKIILSDLFSWGKIVLHN